MRPEDEDKEREKSKEDHHIIQRPQHHHQLALEAGKESDQLEDPEQSEGPEHTQSGPFLIPVQSTVKDLNTTKIVKYDVKRTVIKRNVSFLSISLPKTDQETIKYIEAIGEVGNNSKSYQLQKHFHGEHEAEYEITDLNKSEDNFYGLSFFIIPGTVDFTSLTYLVDHGVLCPKSDC